MFGPAVDAAAKAHALADYPKESCGIVSAGSYVPLPNSADDPENAFKLPPTALTDHVVQAVLHSHCFPKHGAAPSAPDMAAQIEAAIPFGIIWTDGKAQPSDPIWWGDFRLDEPLFDAKGGHIPRQFLHGVHDCYALVRTWFWQARKIKLPEFPRDDEWWKNGGDLYRDGFVSAGFEILATGPNAPAEIAIGDCVMMKWGKWPVPFHSGVIVENGLILHHLVNRLSRREPLNVWRRQVTHWMRHKSVAPPIGGG